MPSLQTQEASKKQARRGGASLGAYGNEAFRQTKRRDIHLSGLEGFGLLDSELPGQIPFPTTALKGGLCKEPLCQRLLLLYASVHLESSTRNSLNCSIQLPATKHDPRSLISKS